MCLSADWAGILTLSNSFVHCFVLCVGVRVSRPCMLLLAVDVPVPVGSASALRGLSPFSVLRGSSLSLLLFGGVGAVAVSFSALVACVLAVWPALSWLPPSLPSSRGCPLVLSGPVSALLVPPSGYLVVSATVRLSYLLAWRVVADWLLSSLRFMATKASALCGALPSTPWSGCCSCALRSCTEVFALG